MEKKPFDIINKLLEYYKDEPDVIKNITEYSQFFDSPETMLNYLFIDIIGNLILEQDYKEYYKFNREIHKHVHLTYIPYEAKFSIVYSDAILKKLSTLDLDLINEILNDIETDILAINDIKVGMMKLTLEIQAAVSDILLTKVKSVHCTYIKGDLKNEFKTLENTRSNFINYTKKDFK